MMSSVTSPNPEKQICPKQQKVAAAAVSPPPTAKQAKTVTTKRPTGGFCRGFSDCLVMGSTASRHHPPPPPAPLVRFQKQLAEIEMELEKQKEVRSLYKMKLERTQDYLRHCLQVAQDNGFLDLIIGNKSKEQESLLSSPATIISNGMINNPQINNPPVHDHPDLAALVEQAKMQGWYIQPNEIKLQEKVGEGTTAEIYKGRWRGFDVAVKCIFPDLFISNDNMIGFFAQEVETLARQRHPFVLQLMGACLGPPNHGWIVTEFLNTTLKIWIHGPGNRRKERRVPLPSLKDRLKKALEISQAMQYLHEHKPMIIHRDLKPSNIFLDDDLHVKVADFGHARYLIDGEKALTGETGTYVYMAPEVIKSAPYDEKSDVYSFGIILNELITGEHPYIETEYGPSKIALEVANNGLRPALPKHDNNEKLEEIIQLIQHSWDEDSAIRPPFSTITSCLRNFLNKLQQDIL